MTPLSIAAAERTYAQLPHRHRKITREAWRDGVREAVLAALDAYICTALDIPTLVGATDADLPELFPCIDAHADRLAARINDPNSTIPGSAFLDIVDPEAA